MADIISQKEIDALLNGDDFIDDISKLQKHNNIRKISGLNSRVVRKGKRKIFSDELLDKINRKVPETLEQPQIPEQPPTLKMPEVPKELRKPQTSQVSEIIAAANSKSSTGFGINYADKDLERASSDRQRYEKEQVDDFEAKQQEKEQKEWEAKDMANNRWAEDNGITTRSTEDIANNPGRLYKRFIDDFNKDGTQKIKDGTQKIGAIAERDYAGHFNKDLSVTNKRKEQLLSRRWKKTLENVTPDASRETYKQEKIAMEKFSKDYNLGIDLSNYKTSTMGRIANRIRGNKNISRDEALQRMHDAYMSKTDEYLKGLKEQHEAGKLSDKQYLRRANVGYTKRAAAIERGETKASKLGWKGKAGAAAALLALGGVIGNQFSGGHQSNAQLYNPNPQPQYAN